MLTTKQRKALSRVLTISALIMDGHLTKIPRNVNKIFKLVEVVLKEDDREIQARDAWMDSEEKRMNENKLS